VTFWAQKKNDQNQVFAAQEKGMAPMGGVSADTAWVSVQMTSECLSYHRKFDRELDFFMKANAGKVGDMYNRVVPNVLRVAVNLAAGLNPFAPVIDLDVYRWAQAFVLSGNGRQPCEIDYPQEVGGVARDVNRRA
jgi:hypothetical protein